MAFDEEYHLNTLTHYLVEKADGSYTFNFPHNIDKAYARRVIDAHLRAYEICGKPFLLLSGVIIGWMQVDEIVKIADHDLYWCISDAGVFDTPIPARGKLRIWQYNGDLPGGSL